MIAVPVAFKGEVLGALTVENTSEFKPLTVNDRDLIMSLGSHLAVAIVNARSFEEVNKALQRTQELEQQQREARELFQRYVPTEVVDERITSLSHLASPENRNVSVMFVDIIGFTTFSESTSPEKVAGLLSLFIEYINETVMNFGGRINKLLGDGCLIYFEPKLRQAVPAGCALLENLPRLNERLVEYGFPPIAIGIGAHQGHCTIGNIGYDKRLDYTLVGDAVNTASRIQDLTRQWGKNVFCISDTLLEEIDVGEMVRRGSIPLKGRSTQVEIFQIVTHTALQATIKRGAA